MIWLVTAASVTALGVSSVRWLRIAQREHYLPGSVSRFAWRWWTGSPINVIGALAMAAAAAAALRWSAAALATAVLCIVGPWGLGLRGRTSKLVWTKRLRTTAAVAGTSTAMTVVLAVVGPFSAFWLALLMPLQPLMTDIALAMVAPFERRSMRRFVAQATAKLRAVDPLTVAITGSYGKTTTKNYLRHLLSGSRSVLASPASFNNTGGLSRTMNEHLVPGTEVLIAEMGTYGPGEIRALCSWVQPDVAAIVNIGPVHLERMRSLDGIVAAKREIFENASICVVNIDAHGLAAVADQLTAAGKTVIRVSGTRADVDAAVIASGHGFVAYIAGESVATVDDSPAAPANVAAAIGLALGVGLDRVAIAARLGDLPGTEHRHQISTGSSGATVIDNTFSSNPASATASLGLLRRLAEDHPGATRIVVTPGMVELGTAQTSENLVFGRSAAAAGDHLVTVGRTNRAALRRGAEGQRAGVISVATRDDAVAWVKAHAGPGDVVLYEGDLPDHYP